MFAARTMMAMAVIMTIMVFVIMPMTVFVMVVTAGIVAVVMVVSFRLITGGIQLSGDLITDKFKINLV